MDLVIGSWAVINGILHNAQVLREHKGGYNRELLYLLLNRHIIILSGVFEVVAFWGLREGQVWGFVVSGIAAFTFFVYCMMIWPFLKSVVTMVLQGGLFVLLLMSFLR